MSIFLLGHTVDLRPWEVFAMYLLVFIVSVFYELLTHHIDHVVSSRSGKRIVTSIYKEVMILGGISLILTILENTAGEILFQAVFWHYVHFVVFFMMVNLIACIAVLFLFIERSWHRWSCFEHEVLGVEHDPRFELDEKQALLSHFFRRYGSHKADQMMACILFFRSNLPPCYRRVTFTKYMTKQQRKELLCFLDVHATAWMALAVLCFFVAVQTDLVATAVGSMDETAAGSSSGSADGLLGGSGSGTGSGSGMPDFGNNSAPNATIPLNATKNATGSPTGVPTAVPTGSPEVFAANASNNTYHSGSTADSSASGMNMTEVCLHCPCGSASGSGSGPASQADYAFEMGVMGVFILIEGYGTAFVVWLCYRKVRSSYASFADNVQAMRRQRRMQPLKPQNYYFWRGSPGFTMHILQVMLLYQVFYLATVTCNYASRLFEIRGGTVVFIVALVPPVLVCAWLIPGLMPRYTILKSVGDLLDHGTLADIHEQEESSGSRRRIVQREAQILEPPPALLPEPGPFDQDVELLDRLDPSLRLRNTAFAPARLQRQRGKYAFLHDADPGSVASVEEESPVTPQSPQQPVSPTRRRRRTDIICEECSAQPASVTCHHCGMLCAQCDIDYHRLRRNASHHRIPLKANDGLVALSSPLHSDQPVTALHPLKPAPTGFAAML